MHLLLFATDGVGRYASISLVPSLASLLPGFFALRVPYLVRTLSHRLVLRREGGAAGQAGPYTIRVALATKPGRPLRTFIAYEGGEKTMFNEKSCESARYQGSTERVDDQRARILQPPALTPDGAGAYEYHVFQIFSPHFTTPIGKLGVDNGMSRSELDSKGPILPAASVYGIVLQHV